MNDGIGLNRTGDVAIQGTQPESYDQGVEKASNPQRLNRSSIETVPGTKRKVLSSPSEAKEFTPLRKRKIAALLSHKIKLLVSRPKKRVDLQNLGGVQQQNKALTKMYGLKADKTAQTKPQAEKLVQDFQDGVDWAKSNRKKAAQTAKPALQKQAAADKAGVPANLTPVEQEALQELDVARELVSQFEGKLAEAKSDRRDFNRAEKMQESFTAQLEKLEQTVSDASRMVKTRFAPLSLKDHNDRVASLEKQLPAAETALKELNKLAGDIAKAEEKHSGVAPKQFDERVKKLSEKAQSVQSKGPEVLEQAKSKRNQIKSGQLAQKQAKKENARAEQEIQKFQKKDQRQDNSIQKKQRPQGQKTTATQPSRPKQPAPKASNKTDGIESVASLEKRLNALKNSPIGEAVPQGANLKNLQTQKAGSAEWSETDEALERRLQKLKGEVVHEPITPGVPGKSFEDLRQQIHNISSVDDLKAVIADRRATDIPMSKQHRFMGLVVAVVQGMAKNPTFAEQMSEGLIRDILPYHKEEANEAIAFMGKTRTENLERRLDMLRRSKN